MTDGTGDRAASYPKTCYQSHANTTGSVMPLDTGQLEQVAGDIWYGQTPLDSRLDLDDTSGYLVRYQPDCPGGLDSGQAKI